LVLTEHIANDRQHALLVETNQKTEIHHQGKIPFQPNGSAQCQFAQVRVAIQSDDQTVFYQGQDRDAHWSQSTISLSTNRSTVPQEERHLAHLCPPCTSCRAGKESGAGPNVHPAESGSACHHIANQTPFEKGISSSNRFLKFGAALESNIAFLQHLTSAAIHVCNLQVRFQKREPNFAIPLFP
jgi:hypothetical protein